MYSIVSGYVNISYTEFVLITVVCGLSLSASASRLARPAEFMEPMSVCLPICLSHVSIVSKRINMSCKLYLLQTFTTFFGREEYVLTTTRTRVQPRERLMFRGPHVLYEQWLCSAEPMHV